MMNPMTAGWRRIFRVSSAYFSDWHCCVQAETWISCLAIRVVWPGGYNNYGSFRDREYRSLSYCGTWGTCCAQQYTSTLHCYYYLLYVLVVLCTAYCILTQPLIKVMPIPGSIKVVRDLL